VSRRYRDENEQRIYRATYQAAQDAREAKLRELAEKGYDAGATAPIRESDGGYLVVVAWLTY